MAWSGIARQVRHGAVRRVGLGGAGWAWLGLARSGTAGMERRGLARCGSVRQVWHGLARFDAVRYNTAGKFNNRS